MIEAKTIKYKKTGIDWMPEVPEHWDIKRLGGLFEERNETVSENDYAPLSVTMKGIVPQLESAAKTMHVDNRKKVCVGDFAINSRSDRRGSGGLSNLEGSVSIVNTVLKPSKFYVPEYTHYLLTNKLFQDEYYAKGKGIVADMWSTRFSEMKTIYLPVPPKNEQDEIVQYIKAQEEKINLFIQKKQRFIELLKEQRASVVDEVITRGLNTKVKFKESEIEWLSLVPEHWKTYRLRFLCKITTGGKNTEDREDDGEYPFYVRSQTVERINSYSYDGVGILTAGDGVGVGRVFHLVEGKFDFHQRVYLFYEISELVMPEFLFNYLQNNMIKELMLYNAKSTVDSVRLPVLKDFQVLIPPFEEQKQIVEYIKTETATIDTAIAKAEREIELIREYKEAMIAEAVMGKRKKLKWT